MTSIKKLISIISISLIFLGCSNSSWKNQKYTFKIYDLAKKNMNMRNLSTAIEQLQYLDYNNSLSPYTKKIQLSLIYAYYKNGKFKQAIESIKQFICLNPTSNYIDYLIYIRGLIHISLNHFHNSQNLFSIELPNRNLTYTHVAFQDFLTIIKKYPNSIYYNYAIECLFYLENELAHYDMSVIKFYYQKKAYMTVIHRTKEMIRKYPNFQNTHDALQLMEISYQKLNLIDDAEKIKEILK